MATLVKQPIDISFAKGLDTKTDPWRVDVGNFLGLVNMVFTTGMRLTKRNGFASLTDLPKDATFLTTFNENLTAIGEDLQAYSPTTNEWINKGALQPVELQTLPLIRSNTNQSQVDTAISNGLVCTVYTDQTPTSLSTPRYLYSIANVETGQSIVNPTLIVGSGVTTGSPRVFALGSYFIVIFTDDISGVYHLKYIAISINNPSIVTAPADISLSYNPSPTLSWDGVVYDNFLYVAYDTSSGGQSIAIKSLSSTLLLSAAIVYTNSGKVTATIMSMTVDSSNPSNPIIWAAYYDSGTSTGYAVAVTATLGKILATPAEWITSGTILNVATAAMGGTLTIYYEVSNTYSYDSSIASNYVAYNTVTSGGTVGTNTTLVRSVGLASKAFISGTTQYFMGVYSSSFQPTYFLINDSGKVVARLAYSNGGGYCTVGLPSVTVNNSLAYIGYLFKDFITSANTSQTLSITKTGIYSQTGLNLATFTIGTSNVVPSEIAQALHLSGGFLWEYDGYIPVEHNFYIWPDNVEGTAINSGGSMVPQLYQYQAVYTWTDNQGNIHYSAASIPINVDMSSNNPAFTQPSALTPTASGTSGTFTLTVSSATGLAIGQYVTDTSNPSYIQTNSYITNISGTTVTLNLPLAGSPSGDNLSITSICSATIDIPTLRLTYKTANPVKIELFRWSTTQEEFFQVTNIETPLINNPLVDSISFTDTAADNQILGNSLIYTTGGVVEDIGAPSFNALSLFDDRLWGIDAEDPNLLWYSKQVIESTPVEMSDLLTLYVAPSLGSQGSTGVMKCLAPLDDKLIIFKDNALYYINGTGPDNTGSNSQYSEPLFITSVVGSSNQQSIVFMPQGLMFQSDKGIWLLDRGMQVSYIGAPVEAYTKLATVQSALAVPGTTQVRFTLNSGITLMYDYFYGQWGIFEGVKAISSTLYEGLHTFLDAQGNVYQETPGTYLDGSVPVVMSLLTAWINLAGLQGYQRAYFMYLLGEYITPHFLQVTIAYDYDPSVIQTSVIGPDNYSGTYGSVSPYGQQTPYGGVSAREQWRIFFANQRCQAFQLGIQEIYDPSLGVPAGAGLTISGLNCLVSIVRGFKAISARHSVGGGANGDAGT